MNLSFPKISCVNNVQAASLINKSPNISFVGRDYDVFEKSTQTDEYSFNIKKTLKKLQYGELSKEYLDGFLLSFEENDREIAKEIICQSMPNLNYCNLLAQMRYFQGKCKINNVELVKMSSFVDMVKYFAQRQNIRMFSVDNYSDESNKTFGKFGIVDGIFSRELSQDEIEKLSDLQHLSVINFSNFEIMPNFIDFAISDNKAKEKIDKLIKTAKQLMNDNPHLSLKEAIKQAQNKTLKSNLDKINTLRKEKGFSEVKVYSNINPCENYNDIDRFLNSVSNLVLPYNQDKEEFLKDLMDIKFKSSKELAQALASDEFTYYSPKGVVDSLKVLMAKLKSKLEEDGIKFEDCLFVYKDAKSEAFIGYLLEELGEIKKEQRIMYKDVINYLKENQDKQNCIVYVDDILGTGDTVDRYFTKLENCKKYCAHIVSCKNGREHVEHYGVEQLYVKNSFDGSKSKNKLISFHSLPAIIGAFFAKMCYSSEVFFFSYPDTASDPYQDFAHRILGIEKRKEYP